MSSTEDVSAEMNAATVGQLKAIVERVERLHEEKKALSDDVRDIYAEAKAHGFSTKAIKRIVTLRRQDVAERKEDAEILDLYLSALGMEV